MKRLAGFLVILGLACAFAPGCSVGEGTGSVMGTLNIPDCWKGPFDLKPDFFAAVPYNNTSLQIRIQNGSDFETFSDGVEILVDNISIVRDLISRASDAGGPPSVTFKVGLPPAVVPAGVVITPDPDPPIVHITLYLGSSCHTQNEALYAVEAVSAIDECTPSDAGTLADATLASPSDDALQCVGDADGLYTEAGAADAATADAGAPAGLPATSMSFIRFRSLQDGNPAEANAQDRLNDGDFTIFLADPRTACPANVGPPPPCRGQLTGSFKFYYQNGQPAQPFP